jgi:hypothetical protein
MPFQSVRRKRPGEAGELHWNSRLTDWDRLEICRLVMAGETYRDIGEAYGISPVHVGRVYRKVVEDAARINPGEAFRHTADL